VAGLSTTRARGEIKGGLTNSSGADDVGTDPGIHHQKPGRGRGLVVELVRERAKEKRNVKYQESLMRWKNQGEFLRDY